MTLRLIMGIVIGTGLGALMGYLGKCSSGACPLTANPYRGAIYGGILGALFSFSGGAAGGPKVNAGAPVAATPIIGTQAGEGHHTYENGVVVHITTAKGFDLYITKATLPCLVDFYSDHCSPCRMVAPAIEELARKYEGRAVVCKVSLDVAPDLAEPHGITGIPAVLFFDGGKEVQRMVGLQLQADYERVLDAMLAKHNPSGKEPPDANL